MLTIDLSLSRISSSDTFLLRLTGVIPLAELGTAEFAEVGVATGATIFLFLSDMAIGFTFPLKFLVILSGISSFSMGFVY